MCRTAFELVVLLYLMFLVGGGSHPDSTKRKRACEYTIRAGQRSSLVLALFLACEIGPVRIYEVWLVRSSQRDLVGELGRCCIELVSGVDVGITSALTLMCLSA